MGRKRRKNGAGAKPKKAPSVKELEKIVVNIVAEIAEVDKKKIKPNTNFVEDLNMDSMMALEILAAIEKIYKIEIPEESLPRMTNLKEIMKLVKRLLA